MHVQVILLSRTVRFIRYQTGSEYNCQEVGRIIRDEWHAAKATYDIAHADRLTTRPIQ